MWNGYQLPSKIFERGTSSGKNGIWKGNGLDLNAEPSCIYKKVPMSAQPRMGAVIWPSKRCKTAGMIHTIFVVVVVDVFVVVFVFVVMCNNSIHVASVFLSVMFSWRVKSTFHQVFLRNCGFGQVHSFLLFCRGKKYNQTQNYSGLWINARYSNNVFFSFSNGLLLLRPLKVGKCRRNRKLCLKTRDRQLKVSNTVFVR